MSDGYWSEALKDTRVPLPDDITPVGTGDSDSSEGIAELLRNTRPDRISQAGQNYLDIAAMCKESVERLRRQAEAIAGTLGGDSLKGVFETIGQLQRDLAQINFAANSVGAPLKWYGDEVLPWFRNNVPGTGSVGWDDDIYDSFGSNGNGHALARHHLKHLNTYMVDVYGAITGYVEQRSKAPLTGVPDVNLGGMPGLTADPYAGSGLNSPYASPALGTPPGGPDIPGLQDPSLKDPSLTDPSLRDPSLKDPSLQDPSLKDPSLTDPSLRDPSLQTPQTPDLKTPDLKTPELNTPDLSRTPTPSATDLSSLQPAGVTTQPPTGTTTIGPGLPSGTSAATPFGGAGAQGLGARAGGAAGMPMGMMPPMMGGGQGGQERDRERDRLSLVEDEAFESDDMGGPSVIA
ncbi:hypothetical protein [Nonomuraea sp. NPDC050643]|uniref:hypothetical protein n=1 Tax=Nonomuraea sp. NPDC050643 TaxID=3155660 RepID=UPI00340954EF